MRRSPLDVDACDVEMVNPRITSEDWGDLVIHMSGVASSVDEVLDVVRKCDTVKRAEEGGKAGIGILTLKITPKQRQWTRVFRKIFCIGVMRVIHRSSLGYETAEPRHWIAYDSKIQEPPGVDILRWQPKQREVVYQQPNEPAEELATIPLWGARM